MPYCHLAGGENELRRLVQSGTDAILVSYYYVRKHKQEVLDALIPLKEAVRTGKISVLLDSGAFSFFGKGADRAELEGYMFEYVSFIRQYHELFTACVELDVGSLVGQDVVEEWRENIFGAITRDIPDIYVIYVWHKDDGYSSWVELCKKHPYVGLGSDAKVDLQFYKKMVSVASKYGTRVHGFAITRKQPMRHILFHSVDSTSWLMGGKYGATFCFTGSDLERVDDDKTARNRYKTKWIKAGFDWTKIQADVRSEINAVCAYSWVEYSKWLDKKRRLKVYWRNDIAGKIAASFANTHHHQHLSKAQQMKITWGEEEWRQVMAASNAGKTTPAGEEAAMVVKKKRQQIQTAAQDITLDAEAHEVAEHLEVQDINQRERLAAQQAAKDRIDELRRVAPDLIERSQRIAGLSVPLTEDDEFVVVEILDDADLVLPHVLFDIADGPTILVQVVDDEDGVDPDDEEGYLDDLSADDPSDDEVEEVAAEGEEVRALSVLSVDDRSIQRRVVEEENGVNPDTVSADDLARIIPMRRDGDDAEVGEGKLAPLDKNKRELAKKRLLHGLKNGNAMMCNTCFVSDTCPVFQKDSTCGLIDQSALFGVAPGQRMSPRDMSKHQLVIAQQMMVRAQTMAMFEQMQGGYLNKDTHAALKDAFDFAERAKGIMAEENLSSIISINSEPSQPQQGASGDAEEQHEPQPSQSMLSRLFGLGPEQTMARDSDIDEFEVEGVTDAEFKDMHKKAAE